jgi:hypothetical protein
LAAQTHAEDPGVLLEEVLPRALGSAGCVSGGGEGSVVFQPGSEGFHDLSTSGEGDEVVGGGVIADQGAELLGCEEASGHADAAEHIVDKDVCNRSDDLLPPIDLPERTAEVIRNNEWGRPKRKRP